MFQVVLTYVKLALRVGYLPKHDVPVVVKSPIVLGMLGVHRWLHQGPQCVYSCRIVQGVVLTAFLENQTV